jgi:hypothetical protein
MRLKASILLGVLLVFVMAGSARAQEQRFHVHFGGGPTFNFGEVGERFGHGWGPAVGVAVDVTPRIGVMFEYAYRYFRVRDDLAINATRFSANHQTHQLAFNMVANVTHPDSPVRVYAMGGPAMYNRNVKVTEYQGSGVICDPWLYLCGTYPIESVVGSRGGWDPGINVGAGVGLPIGEGLQFYIETRFHYVWGPEIVPEVNPVDSAAGTQKTNGQYFPLTFGFRF